MLAPFVFIDTTYRSTSSVSLWLTPSPHQGEGILFFEERRGETVARERLTWGVKNCFFAYLCSILTSQLFEQREF
jgi:hypothetical protein